MALNKGYPFRFVVFSTISLVAGLLYLIGIFNYELSEPWQISTKALGSRSRSRPYHKNDNRFVEENNSSLVRAYLGFQRLDTVSQTILLNQLYDKLWLYHNFFQPVMRLPLFPPPGDPLLA